MDHVRTIAYIPFLIVMGIVGAVRERRHHETDEEYVRRTFKGTTVIDWRDGSEE